MDALRPVSLYDEISILVFDISTHQRALGLSDVAFVARYPVLGSVRTWRTRMVNGSLDQLRVEGWAPRLRQLLAEIKAEEKPAVAAMLDPIASIHRHVTEAARCQLEGHWDCAAAHLAAAGREIAATEKAISDSIPF